MNVRWRGPMALAVALLILVGGALSASAQGNGTSHVSRQVSASLFHSSAHSIARFVGLNDDEAQVASGTLDDGKDLLPQAKISVEQAIAAARTAATGDIGEIDLEHYQGHLVFNVDVGDQDVKVDASTGKVLGSGKD